MLEDFQDEKPKKKPNEFFKEKKKQGKVITIDLNKKRITVDVNGNGEFVNYIEGKHSNLKIGDPIEF